MMMEVENKNYKISDIYPPVTDEKLEMIVKIAEIPLKKQDIKKIPTEIESQIVQLLVKKNIKTRSAIFSRFIQYLDYLEDANGFTIDSVNEKIGPISIDMILKNSLITEEIWAFIFEVFDKNSLNQLISKLDEMYDNKELKKTDRMKNLKDIYLICGKINRNIIDNLSDSDFMFRNVTLHLFMDYIDPNRPFSDNDTIIIDDISLKGFNFSSTDDILSVLKKEKGKGKYKILVKEQEGSTKLIWEGIIFPKKLFESLSANNGIKEN